MESSHVLIDELTNRFLSVSSQLLLPEAHERVISEFLSVALHLKSFVVELCHKNRELKRLLSDLKELARRQRSKLFAQQSRPTSDFSCQTDALKEFSSCGVPMKCEDPPSRRPAVESLVAISEENRARCRVLSEELQHVTAENRFLRNALAKSSRLIDSFQRSDDMDSDQLEGNLMDEASTPTSLLSTPLSKAIHNKEEEMVVLSPRKDASSPEVVGNATDETTSISEAGEDSKEVDSLDSNSETRESFESDVVGSQMNLMTEELASENGDDPLLIGGSSSEYGDASACWENVEDVETSFSMIQKYY